MTTTTDVISIDADGLQSYATSAVEDLSDAIDQYPRLAVFLGLARSGLQVALRRAAVEPDARRRFFGLRGAIAIAAGTLHDVRVRHPALEAESSLICDVAYGLADLAKMRPQEAA